MLKKSHTSMKAWIWKSISNMNQLFKIILLSLLCSIPALLLIWRLLTDNLGANPVEYLEHTTGDWTIYFLLMTLMISPLQKQFSVKWHKVYLPTHLMRRILGLAAFGYALLHLTSYVVFDMGLSLSDTLSDIIERPFITIGMVSFVLLFALSITSSNYAQRLLKQNWIKLHKSIYVLTFLGILHYALLVKEDFFLPALYMLIFAGLMMFRWRKN